MAIKSKKVKMTARQRRKFRIRKKASGTAERPRLSVYKGTKHTYAQVISDVDGKTLVGASTKDKDVQGALSSVKEEGLHSTVKSSKSVLSAKALGAIIAKKCAEKGIQTVVFDRNGFLFHGRVKAIADGAVEAGLKI